MNNTNLNKYNEDYVEKVSLTLFRSSRRFAIKLVNEESVLSGHNEALFAGLCIHHWKWCKIHPLMLPQGSIMTLSGHHLWLHGYGSAFTLRGIASFDLKRNSLDMNMYLSNEEIPRNRMYHPVKCEEELHLESLTPCLMKNDENKTDFFINGCLRELWMLIPRSNRTLQLQFLNLSLSKSKNTKKSSSINNRSLYENDITNANVNTNAQEMKMKIKRITDIAKTTKNLNEMKYQFCTMCGCQSCTLNENGDKF